MQTYTNLCKLRGHFALTSSSFDSFDGEECISALSRPFNLL